MAKILIIDDEEDNREAMALFIKKFGHTYIEASDGEKGLKLLDEHGDIDILIVDVMMPKVDGYELTEFLRREEKHKDLPIIIVSGSVSHHMVMKLIKQESTYFVKKPVDNKELKDRIEKCLS